MIKLEEGETILLVARRHWFIFAGETIFLLLLAVVPSSLLLLTPPVAVEQILTALSITSIDGSLLTFLWSIWILVLWTVFALLWTNYYLDVWVLTNYRIIDIEQLALFNRHVSSFRLDQIQDATVKVSGLLATLIGFGTVEIRTASNESFKFKGVAEPQYLKERIMSEHHRVHS